MALENLFIRSLRTIGGIQLDAVIREDHSTRIKKTTNPIEVGADITDHAIIEPDVLRIIAHVSDTPLGSAAFGEIIDFVTGLFGTSTAANITRSNAAYNAIVQLAKEREPITAQSNLKLYENMLITQIDISQDKDSSKIAIMNLLLEEVLIVESEIVTLEAEQLENGKIRQQGSSPVNSGKKTGKEVDDNTETSVLKTIVDWF